MSERREELNLPPKPQVSYGEPFATHRGWEVIQPGGYSEILVSYPDLKEALDRQSAPVAVVEPIVIPQPVVVEPPVVIVPPVVEAPPVVAPPAPVVPVVITEGDKEDNAGNGTSGDESAPLFTHEGLDALKMDELRVIGEKFKVKDTTKAKLIDKIMDAQVAPASEA